MERVRSAALPEQLLVRPRAGRPAYVAAQGEQHCGRAPHLHTIAGRLLFSWHVYHSMQPPVTAAHSCVGRAAALYEQARRGARAWAGRWIEPARRKAAASRAHCHRCSTHISGEVLTRTKSLFKKIRPIHSSSGRYCMRADKHTRS